MWNVVNFSNVELWIHFSPDSVQRCWNFAMGSVLARLFDLTPQDVWIKLSKPVLDKYFGSVQLSDEKLIHQAAWSTFALRKILLCHLQLNWTLLPSSSCTYFCQRGWNLLREAWNFYRSTVETFLGRPHSLHSIPYSRLWLWRRCFDWTFRTTGGGFQSRLFTTLLASGQQLEHFMPLEPKSHTFWRTTTWSPSCVWRGWFQTLLILQCTLCLKKRIWSGTEFTFMWPSLCVEELCPPADPQLCPLRKEDFCPFMLWVTLPRDYVKVMTDCTLQSNWNFGMITEQVRYMGDDFNFSFSPLFRHFYFTLSTSLSHRCRALLEWRIAMARLGIEWKNTLEQVLPGLLCSFPETYPVEL